MSTNMYRHQGYLAQADVAAYLLVKQGTVGASCALATAATDKILGAADSLAKVTGEMVDVNVGEYGEVRAGGVVARGDWLTTNAASKAIATTTAGNVVFGRAEQSGAADDVIRYRVCNFVL